MYRSASSITSYSFFFHFRNVRLLKLEKMRDNADLKFSLDYARDDHDYHDWNIKNDSGCVCREVESMMQSNLSYSFWPHLSSKRARRANWRLLVSLSKKWHEPVHSLNQQDPSYVDTTASVFPDCILFCELSCKIIKYLDVILHDENKNCASLWKDPGLAIWYVHYRT